jgi:hypothetical protein
MCAQRGDLLPLRGTQLRSPPRMGLAVQGRASAAVTGMLQPLAHGTWRNTKRGGDILLFPALLREVKGAQPAAFGPVTRTCSG